LQSGFLPTPRSVFMPLMDFHSSALSLMLLVFVFGRSCCWLHCSRASCRHHGWSWDWTDLLCLVLLQQNWLHHLGAVLELRRRYGWVIPWLDIGTGSNPCLPCTLPSIQMGFQLHCAGYVKIINNLNFDFNYASFLLFLPVGFSFPSPITPGSLTSPSSHLFLSNLVAVAVPALMAGCIVLANIIVLLWCSYS
jgi:hypothetical protein